MKLSFSLNRCISEAKGDLIARMDGDDRCLPDRFEKQVRFLMSHPEFALVGTAWRRFDEAGEYGVTQLAQYPDRATLRNRLAFAHATVMVRRDVYAALGGYTVSKRTVRGQDRDLWFRLIQAGYRGANLQEPLYLVREDINAIRRRDWRTRVNGVRTTIVGYRLLKAPVYWYVTPLLSLFKLLIPPRVFSWYRTWQARQANQIGRSAGSAW